MAKEQMVKRVLFDGMLNENRVFSCVCNFQNKAIYFTGGQNHATIKKKQLKFDLAHNEWQVLP
eukprot:CAMPEP_0170477140 /NCGR_PEP_ID=MMETSP0123-20130129/18451_1 /TAXON_ID=182087 /ORGANISM="Favella ehrenbergii, Strain Fehren 1" /LENGTH=62 /DNA_ID=CAMNT_0010748673 /DNA_START=278 /DNA_END=466 /DNA_ORIENTATION=-